MEKTVYIDCRRTRRGALTTANGEVVSSSGTGRHWVEKVVLKTGDRIPVTNVSNSGKHNCYWLSLREDGTDVRVYSQARECPICVCRLIDGG